MNQELIEKAKEAKSAEELLAMAKEAGIELTEEQAEAYFAQLGQGELGEEELAAVSGGGCGSPKESTQKSYIGKYVELKNSKCSVCKMNYFRVIAKDAGSTVRYQLKCQLCGHTVWEHTTYFTVIS